MCAGCALAAMAGASGARSWLQAHRPPWLTDQRLRRVTAMIFIVATIIGTTRMSGSGAAPEHTEAAPGTLVAQTVPAP